MKGHFPVAICVLSCLLCGYTSTADAAPAETGCGTLAPYQYQSLHPGEPFDYWAVIGPFPAGGSAEKDDRACLNRDYLAGIGGESAPRQGCIKPVLLSGTAYAWAPHYGEFGTVDFNAHFGRMCEHAAAYAYAEFTATFTGKMVVSVWSDDGNRVWWNGRLVNDNFVYRKYEGEPDLAEVAVRPGVNGLLVKVQNGTRDWKMWTALDTPGGMLVRAVSMWSTAAVDSCLAMGADAAGTGQGMAPLQHAAFWGRAPAAERLLAAGAAVESRDKAGTGALDIAVERGWVRVAEILRKAGAKEPVARASAEDRVDFLCNVPDGPGFAVGVVRDGKAVLLKGYGHANLEMRTPITPHTRFGVGSMMKMMQSLVALRLAEKGGLSLETPVRSVLRELPAWTDGIRMKHLLSHTSGLPAELGTEENRPYSTWPVFVDALARMGKPEAPPGRRWGYSSVGHVLLTMLLQRAGGRTIEQLMRDELFDQVGMPETCIYNPARLDGQLAVPYARYPGFWGYNLPNAQVAKANVIRNAGSVVSTAADMVRLAQALEGKRYLSPGSWRMATTPVRTGDGRENHFGAGLFTGTHRGEGYLEHSGTQSYYEGEFIMVPGRRLSVVMLSNQRYTATGALAWGIVDIFIGRELKERN